jgi:cysteine synthase A
MSNRAFHEVTEAQLLPRVIRLGPNLYGAAFSLMKLIPARYILRRALDRGELGPDTLVVETTSGTFGLALAMQTALWRRRLILVSDPVIDANLRRRLVDLGARLEICTEPAPVGGFQAARLQALSGIRQLHPDSFCPEQYSNPDNPESYGLVADYLVGQLGAVDCVIGTVGSGGSMCGTVSAIRANAGDAYAIGVDSHGSVLFGQPDAPRALRGLGNSLLPANLDHRVFDEVHWCTAGEAFAATRRLHREHALYQGPTSGAAYLVANWWAARHPDQLVVVLLPDEGYRYQETVYHDGWLASHGYRLDQPGQPVEVAGPGLPAEHWTWSRWGRRSYLDVMSPDLEPAT